MEEGVLAVSHADGPTRQELATEDHLRSPRGLTLQPPPPHSCLTGYINHSLSVFRTKDFQDPVKMEGLEHVTECRFDASVPASNLPTPDP